MNKIHIFSSKCSGSSGSVLPWLGDNFDVELNMGYLGVSALLPHKSSQPTSELLNIFTYFGNNPATVAAATATAAALRAVRIFVATVIYAAGAARPATSLTQN